jgi:aspartyl-tRNA(Asn)/glutamyl-tRNA(Gln) amidotransferase subunit C
VQDGIIGAMNRDDITHLASLARIRLEDSELEQFEAELPAIVNYVSAVNSIADEGDTQPNPGVRPNIFRFSFTFIGLETDNSTLKICCT